MNRNALKCSCGQPIQEKDVMQTGLYARMYGPSFVYVRYRCPRCKRKMEKFVKQEEWDESALQNELSQEQMSEQPVFESLGPIEMAEQFDFHAQLEQLPSLREFNQQFADERVVEIPAEESRPARREKRRQQR